MRSRRHHEVVRALLWLMLAVPGLSASQSAPEDEGFGSKERSATYVLLSKETPVPENLQGPVINFEQMIERLTTQRVVFVGERHDRYDHHQNQLAIVRALHQRDPDIAIGMEFFQRPFQEYLDQYVAGEIDQREMLRLTEYYRRWKYDFRLYAPILEYASEQDIPIIALNLPPEVTGPVGSGDFYSLTAEQLEELPEDIDRQVPGYEERLEAIFAGHPVSNIDRFLEVQLLWDEGMADQAADYLNNNPQRRLVVLAGSGHVAYGTGIPDRLARRVAAPMAIVVNDDGLGRSPNVADYVLLSEERSLPKAGMLGVLIDTTEGGVFVQSFAKDSAAADAGMEQGDRITRIAGQPIEDFEDVKLAMWDKSVGQRVVVTYLPHGDGDPVDVDISLR
jgi:uncharacterized iron-regulated protein